MAFDGLRVLVLESRRARELATLVTTYGGEPISAPSMREVPLESNTEALAFADRLERGEFDLVVLLTGVGTRALIATVEQGVAIASSMHCGARGSSRAVPSLLPLCAMCRCPSG